MRRDRAAARQQRRHRVRMRQRYGQRIEPGVILLAEFLGRRHLQQQRLRRDLDRRHRDLVLVGEIADRLDIRIRRDEVDGHRVERADTADFLWRAVGLRPQRDQRRYAAGPEVDPARQERVVHRAGPAELCPADLDVAQTHRLRLLFDEPRVFHNHQREVRQPELLRGAHLAGFGVRRRGDAEREHAAEGRNAGLQASEEAHLRLLLQSAACGLAAAALTLRRTWSTVPIARKRKTATATNSARGS